MKKISRTILGLLLVAAVMLTSISFQSVTVKADATPKAQKFLKGEWRDVSSLPQIYIFGKKYVKVYVGANKSYTKALPKNKKGKYLGKCKIISTKKKGKDWVIRLEGGTYFVGNKDFLTCCKKKNGKLVYYSTASSLLRYNAWKELYS